MLKTKQVLITAILPVLMVGQSAYAAIPTEVSTGVTAFIADVALYGALFITLAVGVATAKIGIKWVKSFFSSAS